MGDDVIVQCPDCRGEPLPSAHLGRNDCGVIQFMRDVCQTCSGTGKWHDKDATIASLRTQLAARDAEVARLREVLTGMVRAAADVSNAVCGTAYGVAALRVASHKAQRVLAALAPKEKDDG